MTDVVVDFCYIQKQHDRYFVVDSNCVYSFRNEMQCMFDENFLSVFQGGREGKGRDAGSRIPHPAGRIFFQFPFPHVRREMIFLNFSFHMWEEKTFFFRISHVKRNAKFRILFNLNWKCVEFINYHDKLSL